MEDVCGIYKIENKITHKKYIGQSIHINERFREHIKGRFDKKLSDIDQAIQDLGAENFIYEILERCEPEELNKKEIYWISFYNTYLGEGYNNTPGGNDTSCATAVNERSVEQYSLDGKYINTFKSASEASRMTNIHQTNITCCCNNHPRYKHAGGYQWKYSNSDKIIIPIKTKIHTTKKKIIGQYTLEEELIATYPSMMEAYRQTGVDSRRISDVCNGKIKMAGNYIWKFIGEDL